MPPDTSDEERQEQLPEDHDTPFTPAGSTRDDTAAPDSARQLEGNQVDDTHPVTDSGSDIDSHELYDEGVSSAAEAAEPNAGNAVGGYTPPGTVNGQAPGDPTSPDADMPDQPS